VIVLKSTVPLSQEDGAFLLIRSLYNHHRGEVFMITVGNIKEAELLICRGALNLSDHETLKECFRRLTLIKRAICIEQRVLSTEKIDSIPDTNILLVRSMGLAKDFYHWIEENLKDNRAAS